MKKLILLAPLAFASIAQAGPNIGAAVSVCEFDANNLEFDTCIGQDFFVRSGLLELRYHNAAADIVGMNGASTATGSYKRQSLGLYAVKEFDLDWWVKPDVKLGAGMSQIDYSFSGPADRDQSFIVTGDGVNESLFYAAGFGLSHKFDRVSVRMGFDYLQHPDQTFIANVGGPNGFQAEPRTYGVTLSIGVNF